MNLVIGDQETVLGVRNLYNEATLHESHQNFELTGGGGDNVWQVGKLLDADHAVVDGRLQQR